MIYNWIINKTSTMGATSGAGTAYPSRASEFTPVYSWGFVMLDLWFSILLMANVTLSM